MKNSEIKRLAEKVDNSKGVEREHLINELVEKVPEIDPLKEVSTEALIAALRLSRKKKNQGLHI